MKLPARRPRRYSFYAAATVTSTLMAFDVTLWLFVLPVTCLLGLSWVIKGD